MTTHFSTKARVTVAFAAALAIGIATPALVNAAMFDTQPANVGRVISDEQAPILVAQGQDVAQLLVRLQQLEEQNRVLNGQVEGLTFQLTQLQELVSRNEARLQALEGGAGPKPEAATQPGGVTQPEALPQDPNATPVDANGVPITDIPEQGVENLQGDTELDRTFTD